MFIRVGVFIRVRVVIREWGCLLESGVLIRMGVFIREWGCLLE